MLELLDDFVALYRVLVVSVQVVQRAKSEVEIILEQVQVVELIVHTFQMALHVPFLAETQVAASARERSLASMHHDMTSHRACLLENFAATVVPAYVLSVDPPGLLFQYFLYLV